MNPLLIIVFTEYLVKLLGYDDLSYGKGSKQSPLALCYPESRCAATNAVDRDNSTCTKTEYIGPSSPVKKTWWYVDLGDVYSVYSIRILFESYGKEYENRQKGRFAGFALYLSNTNNKDDGHLCYKDGPELPPLDLTTSCIGHASHVIFHNERLIGVQYPKGYGQSITTELCEVAVKGCTRGVYGNLCNKHCSEHCQEKRCDIIDGVCLACMSGWTGKFCQTPCATGSYGQDCKLRCSGHCRDGQACNPVTGICDKGCAPGWTRPMCSESCSYGRYGLNCASICSGHCLNGNACNKETGYCDSGCTPGYIGDFCNKMCTSGWFGEGCRQRCSGHCTNDEYCNHVDGFCPNGCKNGYFEELCNKSCTPGYFGKNCSNICSQNCNEICQNTDGSCLCKAGWMGSPMCSTGCSQERYGADCIYFCSTTCANDTCDRFNGSCTKGCKKQYTGEMCNQRDGTSNLQSESMSAKPLIIGLVFGACAFITFPIVLAVLFTRKGISRTRIERRHSQIYVISIEASTAQKRDSHVYQVLDVDKNNGNYVTFDSPKDEAHTYQELHISKDMENYVNMELETIKK